MEIRARVSSNHDFASQTLLNPIFSTHDAVVQFVWCLRGWCISCITPMLATNYVWCRIAGNIGGEFNLVDWRICESTAKLNSAKRHAVLLVPRHMVSNRQIKFRQTAKVTNPPNITTAYFSMVCCY